MLIKIKRELILENTTLSTDQLDPDKLNLALKIVELYEKVQSRPMNYHTKVGEVGKHQELILNQSEYYNLISNQMQLVTNKDLHTIN